MTFELESNEVDAPVADANDNSRLNLSSIVKAAVSLDKELSASGYVKGQQDDFDRVMDISLFFFFYMFTFKQEQWSICFKKKKKEQWSIYQLA